jgi:hypothetical protein
VSDILPAEIARKKKEIIGGLRLQTPLLTLSAKKREALRFREMNPLDS